MREKRDGDLLRLYTTRNSQPAFAEIGRRYARLVYATCLREIGDAALAEDAAQGVFLLLSQKASALARRETLADWLHTASRYVARNLGRQERRRQMNEARAAREAPPLRFDSDNPLWEHIEPHLDDALSRLKPADRNAVLLRFVQEQSLAEVGACLGLSENTARMRVSRALEKIRAHLNKAGIAVSVGLLSALLEEQTSQAAVPATLLARLAGGAATLNAVVPSATLGVAVRQASQRLVVLPVLKMLVVALLIVSCVGGAVYRQTLPQRLSPAERRQAFTTLAGTWTGTLEYADDVTGQRFTYPTRVIIRSLGAGSGLEMEATYTGASNVDVTIFAGDPRTQRFLVTNGGPRSSHGLSGVGDLVKQGNGFAFLGRNAARDTDVRLRFTRTGTRLTIEEDYRTRGSAYQFRNRFSLAR